MKIIIVGGGRVGFYLAKTLQGQGHEPVLVEQNRERCRFCANLLDVTVCAGDGTSRGTLHAAGAEDADVVVAVTGKDECNLVCCQTAKKLFGTKKTVAKVNNPNNVSALKALGVDTVFSETDYIIEYLTREVDFSVIRELIPLGAGDDASIVEITLPENYKLAGDTLMQLSLPSTCNIVCINRDGHIIIPRGQTKLHSGDVLLAVTLRSGERELRRALKL